MSTELVLSNANAAADIYPTYGWYNPWPAIQPWPVVQPTYIYPYVSVQMPATPRCAWCQGQHVDKCPNLKSITYRADGTVERVEFFGETED